MGLTAGTLITLIMIDGVLIDLENKMIETYEQRLQQQEEFNQTLDHLDESILIVSQTLYSL